MKGKASYYFIVDSNEVKPSHFGSAPVLSEFEKRKDTEAIAAFCKLIMLRKDWVKNWEPDWTNNDEEKFGIVVNANRFESISFYCMSQPLSFPTGKMCDEFLCTFRVLLEKAKPLL